MKFSGLIALCSLLAVATVNAEPLVVGFDRFHAAQPSAEGGRLLYNELGCANCHGGETGLPARRGPNLNGVTSRAQADWLRKFLENPSAAHTGSAMPQMVSAKETANVEAILQYLNSLKPEAPEKSAAPRHVNAERGRELFHTLGCVACHAPDQIFKPEEGAPKASEFTYASVAMPALEKKHLLGSLTDFIRNPQKARPDGRMPRIEMDVQDATDLAGYFLRYEGSDGQEAPKIQAPKANAAQAEKGRDLVASLRCAACHDLPKEVAATPVALKQNDGGCLAASPAAGVPQYALGNAQRAALKLYLAARDQVAPPAQLAALTLEALNCVACHERDGKGGPDGARKAYFQGDHNLADVGRFPPPLTGVGRKLKPDWLAKVLIGENHLRPYLQTKMPVFGTAVEGLGTLLGHADKKKEAALPKGNAEAGRKLVGAVGGNSCITCHRWGDRASLGIQALDLMNMAKRLQPGWLAEYLVNPAAYRAGTLMPSFWPEGKAANQEVLKGDTLQQIASIYAYATKPKTDPEGYPSTAQGQFELIPKEHPIVMRSFTTGAGTHSILVGFPEGSHLGYDGLHARPAMAWKGRFFDAYTTWFTRAAPFEKPLGECIVKWPAPATEPADVSFGGYRLDAKRIPTFLYTVGGVHVEERFESVDGGLRRKLTWNADSLKTLDITHPEGVAVTEEPGSAPGKRSFTYIWK